VSRSRLREFGLASNFVPLPIFAATDLFEVTHSDAEWRQLLTPQQYAVLRQDGTEPPGSSPLLNEHRAGVFTCAGCARDLFSSTTKFDSHTGWPSFWAPLDGAIVESKDTSLFMVRTAVRCSPLRRPSGPCLRRWPKADRPALLHERGRDELQASQGLGEVGYDIRRHQLVRLHVVPVVAVDEQLHAGILVLADQIDGL